MRAKLEIFVALGVCGCAGPISEVNVAPVEAGEGANGWGVHGTFRVNEDESTRDLQWGGKMACQVGDRVRAQYLDGGALPVERPWSVDERFFQTYALAEEPSACEFTVFRVAADGLEPIAVTCWERQGGIRDGSCGLARAVEVEPPLHVRVFDVSYRLARYAPTGFELAFEYEVTLDRPTPNDQALRSLTMCEIEGGVRSGVGLSAPFWGIERGEVLRGRHVPFAPDSELLPGEPQQCRIRFNLVELSTLPDGRTTEREVTDVLNEFCYANGEVTEGRCEGQ